MTEITFICHYCNFEFKKWTYGIANIFCSNGNCNTKMTEDNIVKAKDLKDRDIFGYNK